MIRAIMIFVAIVGFGFGSLWYNTHYTIYKENQTLNEMVYECSDIFLNTYIRENVTRSMLEDCRYELTQCRVKRL